MENLLKLKSVIFRGTADVTVNGTQYAVEIEDAGGAIAAIRLPRAAAPCTPPKQLPAAAQAPAVAIAAAGASDVISAPMPGVIMDIAVKPGDKVAVGQPICALEAMKMKNILRSPREGTVASVEVS